MTRDELADLFMVSDFNRFNNEPLYSPVHCTEAEYIAHIRNSKPFALAHAYLMADWAIRAVKLIGEAA